MALTSEGLYEKWINKLNQINCVITIELCIKLISVSSFQELNFISSHVFYFHPEANISILSTVPLMQVVIALWAISNVILFYSMLFYSEM